MESRSRKRLADLEPRKTTDDVRGGALSLGKSSVKVAPKPEKTNFTYRKISWTYTPVR